MILVAGATGLLGGMVARELVAGRSRVRALVRPGSDYGWLPERGVQPVMGDLKDPESLSRACAGVRTVITTANSARRRSPDTVASVDRDGNRALIDAARRAGVEHFIFVSALGAAEDSPSDFLRAKAETERYLQESGLSWTILRPNVFMEVWAGMLIVAPVRAGESVTLVRGDHRHTMVSVRDVARFAVAAVTHPAARNAVLTIGGPEACTWADLMRLVEAMLDVSIEVRYVEPGEPIPGLPAVASGLVAALESHETTFDSGPLAVTFGIRLTTPSEVMRGMLHPIDA